METNKEREADELALEILMPRNAITEYLLNEFGILNAEKVSVGITKRLARKFNVSLYVMFIRLLDLGYYVELINLYEK